MLYTITCKQPTAAAKVYLGVEFQRHEWPELHVDTLPFSLRDVLHFFAVLTMF